MWLSLQPNHTGEINAEIEDEALVQQARKQRAAFAPLYQRYAARVYRYVYSRVGNAADAEDLTAQVFADALAALPRYRPRGHFAGWLFTLAYRRCADHHRRPTADALSEQLAGGSGDDPAEQALRHETFERLQQILSRLSVEENELLRLHYAAELNYRAIGRVLGRSEGAVKMSMSRLMKKLKTIWEVNHV